MHGSRWKIEGPETSYYAPLNEGSDLVANDVRRPEGLESCTG